jgi:hypothetical protein
MQHKERQEHENHTTESPLDLRAEPIVLTVPPIAQERYFSIQLVDAYTLNFDYIGTRTTGNDGGSFLIAGPGWKGAMPEGVKKVFRSATALFVLAGYRTQLFNPGDLDNVKKIQAGYRVQTLSAFLGQPAPQAAPTIDFIKPVTPEQEQAPGGLLSLMAGIDATGQEVVSATDRVRWQCQQGDGERSAPLPVGDDGWGENDSLPVGRAVWPAGALDPGGGPPWTSRWGSS